MIYTNALINNNNDILFNDNIIENELQKLLAPQELLPQD